jgi:Flp pilus assembly pilin Flp
LLAGFISLIAVGAITTVGTGVNQVYTDISNLAPLSGGGGGP